jgi:hypothetical protein
MVIIQMPFSTCRSQESNARSAHRDACLLISVRLLQSSIGALHMTPNLETGHQRDMILRHRTQRFRPLQTVKKMAIPSNDSALSAFIKMNGKQDHEVGFAVQSLSLARHIRQA